MSTLGKHLGGVRTLEDLHARCEEVGECWEWQRCIAAGRVPQVGFNGRPRPARRVAWEMVHGPVPKGKHITHSCGNYKCINPAHAKPVLPATVLARNRANANNTVRSARISATKRAQMGVSAAAVAAVRADADAHVPTMAKRLGISKSMIYKLRKQHRAASPWAGLMQGAT